MPYMLEFWQNRVMKRIYVNFNGAVMTLCNFLKCPEAKKIVELMYDQIWRQFPLELRETKLRTVGAFIREHFLYLDKTFDVVILGQDNRMSVMFNFENPESLTTGD